MDVPSLAKLPVILPIVHQILMDHLVIQVAACQFKIWYFYAIGTVCQIHCVRGRTFHWLFILAVGWQIVKYKKSISSWIRKKETHSRYDLFFLYAQPPGAGGGGTPLIHAHFQEYPPFLGGEHNPVFKVTRYLQGRHMCKRCSAFWLNCSYLKPHLRLMLNIELVIVHVINQ